MPFIGVVGKANAKSKELTGLGLILNTPEAAAARKAWGAGADTEIVGGFNDPVYRDTAPDGGLLVGLELGLVPFAKSEQVKGVRPIYRTGDKETTGPQFGTEFKTTTIVKAKEGYAIGAVTIRAGLRADGLSVTFMKIGKDGLDPKDSYESDWVGFVDPRKPRTLTGDGKAVIGITGKQTVRENTGFGLVLRADKK